MSVNTKYTKEVQAGFIAYLLHKKLDQYGQPFPGNLQKGVKLFKHFQRLDQGVFEATFRVSGFTRIMEVLGSYYTKYNDLPSKTVYDSIKKQNRAYNTWFEKADASARVELRQFEDLIFQPPQDVKFLETELMNFLTESFFELMKRESREALKEPVEDTYKIIYEASNSVLSYIKQLQEEIDGVHEEQYDLVSTEVDIDQLNQLPGVVTCFKSITLYFRGITILVAPPKSFKTGITQNIAVDLLYKGYDIVWIDLENGLHRTVRRFYQNLLGCPKEWIYSNTYVHKDKIALEELDYSRPYSKGEKLYKIYSDKTGEKKEIVIEGRKIYVDEYKTVAKVFQALIDGADEVEDWEELDANDHIVNSAYEPLDQVLTRKLEEIKKNGGGEVRIRYMKKATVPKIRALAKGWQEEAIANGKGFFHPDRPKVFIIDWMQHLKNENHKLLHWEVSRANYQELKDLREEFDAAMLGIEAMSNYEKSLDPHWSLKDLETAGSKRISYDAESIAVVVGTDEEKQKGWRRMYVKEDRDGASGNSTMEMIKIDYICQKAVSSDIDTHEKECPEVWQEWRKGKTRGKSYANNQQNTMEFPELNTGDLLGG